MKRRLRYLVLMTVLLLSVVALTGFVAFAENGPQIKNVIFMIPDGGGFALFDFANAVKEAGGFEEGLYPNATKVTPGPMFMKDYLVGTVSTHSANDAVTDSAAAGTALSSGYKTVNGFVGVDTNGKPRATLLEAAQLGGKRTGIVSTYEWTHATPAAFTAHSTSRSNTAILAEQIVNQGVDVVLGVGFGASRFGSIQEAIDRGYTITNTKDDLAAVEPGTKIWGNHSDTAFPFDIHLTSRQPTLAEMTRAAIRALDGSEEGFFLMVEGSRVDSGGHNNNIVQAVSEFLAFDEAFKVALDYAQSRNDTIVIIVPDHDTGGLRLPNADGVGGNPNSSDYAAAVAEVRKGIDSKNGISWSTGGHTARPVGVWIYVPEGVSLPEGLSDTPGDTPENRTFMIDNTQIAPYLAALMGLDLEEATQELFVDVTDIGTYNPSSRTFTFNDADISIVAYQSVAIVNGEEVDLDGQIAVYSNRRFYVPRILLSMMEQEQ